MDLLKVTMKQVPMGKPGTVGNVANLTDAKRTVPGHRSRREALVAGMLAPGGVCGDGVLLSLNAEAQASGIPMTKVNPSAAEGMRARDSAMQWKCKGGMFDCDGDRREYAKKQYENFLSKAESK